MSEVMDPRTHPVARAAAMVAALGHDLLIVSSPGLGGVMLARLASALQPDLTEPEAWEVAVLQAMARRAVAIPDDYAAIRPPLRMPHHTVSLGGLIGGGSPVRFGECTMAHRGILMLDEIAEFAGSSMPYLCQTRAERVATVINGRGVHRFPAAFTLIGITYACPCGYAWHPDRVCVCSAESIARYRARVARAPAPQVTIALGDLDRSMVPGLARAVPQDLHECAARVAAARAVLPPSPSLTSTCAALGFPKGTDRKLHGAHVARRWADACRRRPEPSPA